MTATLTTQSGMLPTSGDTLTKYRAEEVRRGVNLGFGPVPPGQLWERVAERSEQTYRYVWRGGMPRGQRVCVSVVALLGRHACPRYETSGVIRAGERIK